MTFMIFLVLKNFEYFLNIKNNVIIFFPLFKSLNYKIKTTNIKKNTLNYFFVLIIPYNPRFVFKQCKNVCFGNQFKTNFYDFL